MNPPERGAAGRLSAAPRASRLPWGGPEATAPRESRTPLASRHRRDYVFRRVLAVADMVAVVLAASIAFAVSPVGGVDQLPWLLPILPVWVALFGAYGLYQRESRRISPAGLDDMPAIFHALVVGTLGMWLYYNLVPAHHLVFVEALAFGAVGLAVITGIRSLARRVITYWLGPEPVLFMGESRSLPALVRKIRDHPEYGLAPVGLLARSRAGDTDAPLPVIGRIDDASLGELIERHGIERVIVSRSGAADEEMLELFQECRDLGVSVTLLPAQVDVIGPSVEVDDIEGITVLGLNPLTLSRSSRFLKRAMDIVGAMAGLLLLSPLIPVIAAAIKLDSRGPILFKQKRIGRRGAHFRLLKLRTMAPGAEQRVKELLADSEDPHWLKLEHDPRITRVGRFLRLTSLDELPQLWNVLRGDMSLVGPRPLVESEYAVAPDWARTRTDLAPGITGLWQVLGRTNIPFEEMVKLDYLYVTNWSIWLDVKLLLQTLPVVARRRGAN